MQIFGLVCPMLEGREPGHPPRRGTGRIGASSAEDVHNEHSQPPWDTVHAPLTSRLHKDCKCPRLWCNVGKETQSKLQVRYKNTNIVFYTYNKYSKYYIVFMIYLFKQTLNNKENGLIKMVRISVIISNYPSSPNDFSMN